eukprot:m51a1_g7004 hypothetical protein (426) ;mRNA; r:222687-227002
MQTQTTLDESVRGSIANHTAQRHKFSLRFADPRVEALYSEYQIRSTMHQARIGMVSGILAATFIAAYTLPFTHTSRLRVLEMLFLIIAEVASIALTFTKWKKHRHSYQVCGVRAVSLASGTLWRGTLLVPYDDAGVLEVVESSFGLYMETSGSIVLENLTFVDPAVVQPSLDSVALSISPLGDVRIALTVGMIKPFTFGLRAGGIRLPGLPGTTAVVDKATSSDLLRNYLSFGVVVNLTEPLVALVRSPLNITLDIYCYWPAPCGYDPFSYVTVSALVSTGALTPQPVLTQGSLAFFADSRYTVPCTQFALGEFVYAKASLVRTASEGSIELCGGEVGVGGDRADASVTDASGTPGELRLQFHLTRGSVAQPGGSSGEVRHVSALFRSLSGPSPVFHLLSSDITVAEYWSADAGGASELRPWRMW